MSSSYEIVEFQTAYALDENGEEIQIEYITLPSEGHEEIIIPESSEENDVNQQQHLHNNHHLQQQHQQQQQHQHLQQIAGGQDAIVVDDSDKSECISISSAESVETEIVYEHRCCFCYELFQNIKELKAHVKIHKQVPPHERKVVLNKCGICGICFSHHEDLEFHKELHYSFDVSKRHRCFYCAETFSNPLDIYNHNVNYLNYFLTKKILIIFFLLNRKKCIRNSVLIAHFVRIVL